MIKFFGNKKSPKINIFEKFKWISLVDDLKINLARQGFNHRKNQINNVYEFFKKDEGKQLIQELHDKLVKSGLPESSVNIELELLLEIFAPDTINDIFYNPSNGLDKHLKHNQFSDAVSINNNYGFVRVPKGLVFIIGSANTILPVFTSLVLSYICGNINVIQLSSDNSEILQSFFCKLPFQCKDYVYFTNLKYIDNSDNECLKNILREVPWDVVNIWGGEEANFYYYKYLAENKNRPTVLSMEPLTGIVIIQNKYLINNKNKVVIELSKSIREMGQQLCSSPTEAYILDDGEVNYKEDFFNNLIHNLENDFEQYNDLESNYIKLDRMLSHASDKGSEIFKSKQYGNKIVLIKSYNSSVFSSIAPYSSLSVHERRNFLEFIIVKTLEEIVNLIKGISQKETHKSIKKIQTIIVFGDDIFVKQIISLAKLVGAYRIIDHNYVFRRHTLEALDGKHLVSEFTYPLSILGSIASSLE